MDFHEIKKNICRVCLGDSVVLDWNSPVYGYCNITYKDCFYKYTQLNCPVSDPYSSMLCQSCLNSLYNVHTFILKALQSQTFFKETNFGLADSIHLKDIKYTPPEFESILVEKLETEPILQDHYACELSDNSLTNNLTENKVEAECSSISTKTNRKKNLVSNFESCNKTETKRNNKLFKCSKSFQHNVKQSSNKSFRRTRRNLTLNRVEHDTISKEKLKDGTKIKSDDSGEQLQSKVRKKYKEIKKPRMCSICSKILHNKYAVELHEKTHMDNRERTETCKICGLKFYDKRNLYSHKRIHKENREKIHKCEFCDKAFYDKGGLNIHRRIHLGQMIPCSLCSKEFYRQIDLDRHMGSHSATTINSDTKKRSRYFVRCKHCSKSILSTSFKSHTAAHLNEPLMKCSICGKEFFRRASCVLHIKKVHQKTNEEYNNFIVLYTKNRISHLFLEQKAEIQYIDE